MEDRSFPCLRLRLLVLGLAVPINASANTILDYQDHLNPSFAKRRRQDTRFIVIHSTECGLPSALRTLSRGKLLENGRLTQGGHAHYLLSRSGTIYRILDPAYRADHAGLSMWTGIEDLSDHSLGIELEGFHDVPFTASQYRSLRWLVGVLRRRFHVASRDVLEHWRVAYALPNRFHSRSSRGRKRDPGLGNFDRRRAGLHGEYAFDPDVLAGRVLGPRGTADAGKAMAKATPPLRRARPSGVIDERRTAWAIAGARYRDATTLYVLPDGTARRGPQVRDWGALPAGTEVHLGSPRPLSP